MSFILSIVQIGDGFIVPILGKQLVVTAKV